MHEVEPYIAPWQNYGSLEMEFGGPVETERVKEMCIGQ
jgi:hypothetical protein